MKKKKKGGIGNRFGDKQRKSFVLKIALHRAENLEARKGKVRIAWFGGEEAMRLTSTFSGLFHKRFRCHSQ